MGHEIIKNVYKVDIAQRLIRRDFGLLLGSYDHAANLFVVELVEGFTSYPIDGRIVKGYFIRPDGKTLVLQGEAEGNSAIVGLSDSCYLYDGSFTLTVKVDDQTVLICDGQIAQTRTDQTTEFPEIITHVSDSDLLGGKPPEYYLPLENLLHNSYFPEAVNQRKKTIYTGSVQYTIDCWKTTNDSTTVEVLEDGIRLTNTTSGGGGYLQQTLENPAKRLGKTFTLAAMQTNGTLTAATATLPTAFPSAITQYATLTDNGVTVGAIQVSTNSVWVRIWSNPNETTRSFRWALLCEGAYTKDMLLYRRKPDELADCMRYFQIRSTNNVPASDMRPPMRLTNPTITALGDGTYAYSAEM